jgi:hypothetical protein
MDSICLPSLFFGFGFQGIDMNRRTRGDRWPLESVGGTVLLRD